MSKVRFSHELIYCESKLDLISNSISLKKYTRFSIISSKLSDVSYTNGIIIINNKTLSGPFGLSLSHRDRSIYKFSTGGTYPTIYLFMIIFFL